MPLLKPVNIVIGGRRKESLRSPEFRKVPLPWQKDVFAEKEILMFLHRVFQEIQEEEALEEKEENMISMLCNITYRILKIAKKFKINIRESWKLTEEFRTVLAEEFKTIKTEHLEIRESLPADLSRKLARLFIFEKKELEEEEKELARELNIENEAFLLVNKILEYFKQDEQIEEEINFKQLKEEIANIEKRFKKIKKADIKELITRIEQSKTYLNTINKFELAIKDNLSAITADISKLRTNFSVLLQEIERIEGLEEEEKKLYRAWTGEISNMTPKREGEKIKRLEKVEVNLEKKGLKELHEKLKITEETKEDMEYIIKSFRILFRTTQELGKFQENLFTYIKDSYKLLSRIRSELSFL